MRDRLQRDAIRGAAGLFLLASALYIWGLSPTISWRDSPEFATIAHTLDIGHPAGSPTYALLAKFATFVPLGSLALRVNMFSALSGALGVALVFVLLYELLISSPRWIGLSAAVSGSLFLMVSESFWRFAEVAEVYSLQNSFLLVLLIVLLKAYRCACPTRARYYWLFAFLYGLSAGVHATMALFVPAFLGFIGLTAGRMFRGKALAFLAFFFLLGFAVYLYLPLRSLADPAFDWGDPETFHQFLNHILDRKDAAMHANFSWHMMAYQAREYLDYLINEFSLLGSLLGLLGFLYVLSTDRRLWLLFTLVFLGHTTFFMSVGWRVAWGYIPSFVIFSLWIGYGIYACFTLFGLFSQRHSRRILPAVAYSCLVGGLVVSLSAACIRHRVIANQSANYSAQLYGTHLLEQLPPDAIFFCEYSWFPLLYFQQVEHRRPDLTILLQGEVLYPRFFAGISHKRFPNIRLVTSEKPVAMSTFAYLWHLAKLNVQDHALFWEPEQQIQVSLKEYLLPQGLLFAFHPNAKTKITPEVLSAHWKRLLHATKRITLGVSEKDEATAFLVRRLGILAQYFRHIGLETEAVTAYHTAFSLRPQEKTLHNNYGALLMSQENLPEAFEHFHNAYGQDPIDPTVNKNMGQIMLRLRKYAQAAYFFERTLSFGDQGGDVYAQLGRSYSGLNQFSAALHALQTALAKFQEPTPQNATDAHLQKKIAHVQEDLQHAKEALRNSSPER